MPNGEGKNWVRLCGAIDGFRSRYKKWPTKMRLGSIYFHNIKSLLQSKEFNILQDKLELIIDNVHIIAEDDSGNNYDYSKEGFSEVKPDIRARDWLAITPDYYD